MAVTELERTVRGVLDEGRRAWPSIPTPDDVLAGTLAAKLGGDATPGRKLHAADLFLASACAHGDADAWACFEAAYFDDVAFVCARFPALAVGRDDIAQRLREKLFLATPRSIGGYSGHGELRAWFRAAVLHLVLNVTSRELREEPRDECFFAAIADASPSAEAAFLRRVCRREFEESFATAVTDLDARERLLLRYTFADKLSIDQIGAVFQVHRATAARWVQKAQAALVLATRARLATRLGITDDEADSVVRGALSSLGTTLFRHFGE